MRETKEAREARLAAALRDNLKRRKHQARARRSDTAGAAPDAVAEDRDHDRGRDDRTANRYTIALGRHAVHVVRCGQDGGAQKDRAAASPLWVVDAGERRILIDAGPAPSDDAQATNGALRELLQDAGIAPGSINAVILTDIHADRIGGLVCDGAPALPGVPIHVADATWRYWTDPALAARVGEAERAAVTRTQDLAGALAAQVVPCDGAAALGDGVTLVPVPGEAPGHTAVEIDGGSQTLLILGDIFRDALRAEAGSFAHADDAHARDGDPAGPSAARRAVLARCARSDVLVAAAPMPFPGVGYVREVGAAFRFEPQA